MAHILLLDRNVPEEQDLRKEFSELALKYLELVSDLIRLKVLLTLFPLVNRTHIVQGKY